MQTLATILKDNWRWRRQIGRTAIADLVKQTRGAVLGWAWLFIKPLLFIAVFWFALQVGLRVGREMDPPYFLWLVAGLIPWFFLQEMLGAGSSLFKRYTNLVNKGELPLSTMPTIFALVTLVGHLGLVLVLLVMYLCMGMHFDIYLLQIFIIIPIMLAFCIMNSLITSLLSAVSKDFANLVRAVITPVFWLSGIIFEVSNLQVQWIKIILLFNPVTFFVRAFRYTFYFKIWLWESPLVLGAFGLVFLATLVVMALLYRRFSAKIGDNK